MVDFDPDPEAIWDARIAGRVIDALTGTPIPLFLIRGFYSAPRGLHFPRSFVENDEGLYEVCGLQPGSIRLLFEADGYAPGSVAERMYEAGEHRVEVELLPARDLSLRLVDRNGRPVPRAFFGIRDPGGKRVLSYLMEGYEDRPGHAQLDAFGEAVLHGLPAGPITLRFGAPGVPWFGVDLDLTLPLDGVQEFVADVQLPR